MSDRLTTSPSAPATSEICVTRREPSRRRLMCTTRSSAEAIWSRMARSGRSMPAISVIVSSRNERVPRRVGVHGRQRAVVAGVHGLQHVEGLAAADLADDDAVGPHAQRVAHQVADGDAAAALDVRRTGLEADEVLLVELELGRVLDGDDALGLGDERRQHVEQRRLPGAGAAADQDVEPAGDAGRQELGRLGRQGAEGDQVVDRQPVLGELPDRSAPGRRSRAAG